MSTKQHRRARMRVHRQQDAEAQIGARMAALLPFLGADPEQRQAHIARLLRRERRAAATGLGYDAARHAALRRLSSLPATPSAQNKKAAVHEARQPVLSSEPGAHLRRPRTGASAAVSLRHKSP